MVNHNELNTNVYLWFVLVVGDSGILENFVPMVILRMVLRINKVKIQVKIQHHRLRVMIDNPYEPWMIVDRKKNRLSNRRR